MPEPQPMEGRGLHPAIVAAAVLFWVLPGRLGFDGATLYPLQLTDLAAVILCLVLGFSLPFRRLATAQVAGAATVLAGLALLRVVLGLALVPQGLIASYFPNPHWEGPAEPSWAFPDLRGQATRRDPTVDFDDSGFSPFGNAFALHFLNEERFNWHRDAERVARRQDFPFSAEWRGVLELRPDDPGTVVLRPAVGSATLILGDRQHRVADGEALFLALPPGEHPLRLRYAYPGGGKRGLLLGWTESDQTVLPIPPSRLFPSGSAGYRNQWAGYCGLALTGLYFLALGWVAIRGLRRPVSAGVSLGVAVPVLVAGLCGLWVLLDAALDGVRPDAQVLAAGGDWLFYESQARNILSGDLADAASTNGGPYYTNVLYRYLLAATHLAVGEDVAMVVVVQRLVVVLIVLGLYGIGRSLYGWPVGVVAAGLAIASGRFAKYAAYLLDSVFSVAFSLGALFFLARYRRTQRVREVLYAGVLLALVCGVRANVLAFSLIASAWLVWVSADRWRRGAGAAAILMLLSVTPLLLAAARNYWVAGTLDFLPTSGPVNLWLGNPPPGVDTNALVAAGTVPARSEMLAQVLGFALGDPLGFATGIWRKLVWVLGVDTLGDWTPKWEVLVPNVLALIAFPWMVWQRQRLPWDDVVLFYSWIVVNCAVLVAIFPWAYGWRLQAPTFPAVYLLSALFLCSAWRAFRGRTV